MCLCSWGWEGHFCCPRPALLDSGSGSGGGKGREGWILDPFLGLPVPPGEEDHWLLRLVLPTLSGCPQNLFCMIWDHIPTKGGYPGDPKPSRPGNRTQGGANEKWP